MNVNAESNELRVWRLGSALGLLTPTCVISFWLQPQVSLLYVKIIMSTCLPHRADVRNKGDYTYQIPLKLRAN